MAEVKVKQVKKAEFRVVEIENESAILLVQGWRMRVYFDKDKKDKIKIGQTVEVEYIGDLEDVHSIRFQKLK